MEHKHRHPNTAHRTEVLQGSTKDGTEILSEAMPTQQIGPNSYNNYSTNLSTTTTAAPTTYNPSPTPENINQPYKRVVIGRMKVINYLPRCSYHLLYKLSLHWCKVCWDSDISFNLDLQPILNDIISFSLEEGKSFTK